MATVINTREFGRTDETIEELQVRLREHAKRKRASSPHDESEVEATSSDDEEVVSYDELPGVTHSRGDGE